MRACVQILAAVFAIVYSEAGYCGDGHSTFRSLDRGGDYGVRVAVSLEEDLPRLPRNLLGSPFPSRHDDAVAVVRRTICKWLKSRVLRRVKPSSHPTFGHQVVKIRMLRPLAEVGSCTSAAERYDRFLRLRKELADLTDMGKEGEGLPDEMLDEYSKIESIDDAAVERVAEVVSEIESLDLGMLNKPVAEITYLWNLKKLVEGSPEKRHRVISIESLLSSEGTRPAIEINRLSTNGFEWQRPADSDVTPRFVTTGRSGTRVRYSNWASMMDLCIHGATVDIEAEANFYYPARIRADHGLREVRRTRRIKLHANILLHNSVFEPGGIGGLGPRVDEDIYRSNLENSIVLSNTDQFPLASPVPGFAFEDEIYREREVGKSTKLCNL